MRGWVQFAAHLFQPHLAIVVQATLVVVDEYAGRDVRQ
jgi:hypothetical protein